MSLQCPHSHFILLYFLSLFITRNFSRFLWMAISIPMVGTWHVSHLSSSGKRVLSIDRNFPTIGKVTFSLLQRLETDHVPTVWKFPPIEMGKNSLVHAVLYGEQTQRLVGLIPKHYYQTYARRVHIVCTKPFHFFMSFFTSCFSHTFNLLINDIFLQYRTTQSEWQPRHR